ncbi:fatty acid desaturase family protein [Wenzhouxiangella marina]|uniref:Fatty acid desaturase n=1 Tax=Wenzhouxiangella marina TaxID=1579979 RepID=A0A0K0XV45_9GAMM|nr:acyl-CoA desaturase [Wenzhouxiangella marina]AKS41584.1 fatty acid desaturase [Wenzhouxiangella marina]MBB6086657.1 linoleoyl-CoA desaturase [Wenzhouxiangella marina]
MNDAQSRPSRARLDELAGELDALRAEISDDLGARDADHIRRIVRRAQGSAVAGRGLLMFGWGPISWLLGVIALAHAKILENMEIGHNVLHGQYDWMNDPSLHSQTYDWDIVCAREHWLNSHNVEHHVHTNILGKDHDYGYGMLRLTPEQRWRPATLLQPIWYLLLALLFQWGVAIHDIKLGRFFKGRMSRTELGRRSRPFLRKAARQLFKDYVFFPALAFWQWPRVLLGNLAANGIRNLWTNAIIFCGHFTENAQTFTRKETENETRGQWYLRQILGSSNLEGGRWFHVLSGHLSHQIEHHLFPDMPASRYPEIAPRVRAICERYRIHYNTAGFWRQYFSVLKRIVVHAWPTRNRPLAPA